MKAYSLDFREKIVKIYEQEKTSIRKVANRFNVSKAFVQKLIKQKSTFGHLQLLKPVGSLKSILSQDNRELALMAEKKQMPPCLNTASIGEKLTING
jgi:transposase